MATLTLFINKSDSRCECYANAFPRDTECRECGSTFTHVSSDYAGMRDIVAPMRPDLEPDFPWEDWWKTEAGEQAQQALRELDQADE